MRSNVRNLATHIDTETVAVEEVMVAPQPPHRAHMHTPALLLG
jgi:hypothetical protein